MKKIRRQYLRNRHGYYNGKVKYTLTHNGEKITRKSYNNYNHAAVVCLEPSKSKKVTWSKKPIMPSRSLKNLKTTPEKKVKLAGKYNITYYQVAQNSQKHKLFLEEMLAINSLRYTDPGQEIQDAKTIAQIKAVILDIKKNPGIYDADRPKLITAAKKHLWRIYANNLLKYPDRLEQPNQVDFLDELIG